MKILCVIPSRIASTRLPRKPLIEIQGKPMVQWTFENASRCNLLTKIVVATDSEEIANLIHRCGGDALITDPLIQTGSDRVAAVAQHYPDMDIIINVQGDEPFIKPKMLEQLVAPYLQGETPEMTTLAYPISSAQEFNDPGIVKVVTDTHLNALYFSRAPIPYYRVQAEAPVYHHMGLYAFRRDFLLEYAELPPTPLEQVEALEQLRVLEHGYKIRVCLTQERSLEINTPAELALAQQFEYQME